MSQDGPETNIVASTITSPQSTALHQARTVSFQWTISDTLCCRRLSSFLPAEQEGPLAQFRDGSQALGAFLERFAKKKKTQVNVCV